MLLVGWGVTLGCILGVSLHFSLSQTEVVYAETTTVEVAEPEPKTVLIEVKYNWTEERIEQEIRNVFVEAPNTAVAIAKCESGLDIDIQSQHILSYGQELSFGLFQIHKPDWHETALALGLDEYKTNPIHNVQMARYIYENAGYQYTDWMCYTKGLYKKYL